MECRFCVVGDEAELVANDAMGSYDCLLLLVDEARGLDFDCLREPHRGLFVEFAAVSLLAASAAASFGFGFSFDEFRGVLLGNFFLVEALPLPLPRWFFASAGFVGWPSFFSRVLYWARSREYFLSCLSTSFCTNVCSCW